MVVVLDYNKTESEFLKKIFIEDDIDYKYSLSENYITKADKIILPHPNNFNFSYKKMQLMNLFSFLRLIKKPILGINDGFCFMCDEISDQYKCGLGFFQIDLKSIEASSVFGEESNFVNGEIETKENCKLTDENLNGTQVEFNYKSQLSECEYTTSLLKFKENKFTLTCEYKNYYAVEINFAKNPEISNSIVKNFLQI
jgi:imidazoleglycerol phosphate synthase glutamine amidotransferase subunit HisH